ncbi:Moderate conductance mechanosensitive channel YbiO precursor [Roseivivax jejudonensis]|uniref:Moderate conductance mechanosensitive channel YbiO n=1 Tax=Roseivivax jejudonensis TaxID=1529041 RepID=A0A1X7A4F7_9RHOB|nr:mechanosensitive ion channel domain-containing protein [Roseivivax jejudonensis]SLN69738.1 Moderate conductance mechanosensitive channel YbiO precursor [Roseivivax jejudonensis]
MRRLANCLSAGLIALFFAAFLGGSLAVSVPGTAVAQSAPTGGDGSGGDGGGSGGEEGGAPSEALALQSLLNVLQDDAAREELVTQLEAILEEDGQTEGQGDGEAAEGSGAEGDGLAAVIDQPASLGAQIAELTQSVAETALDQVNSVLRSFSSSDNVFSGLDGGELEVLLDALRTLFIIIAITIAVYVGLRMIFVPIFRRMGARAEESSMLRTLLIYLGSAALDILIVVLAWAIGYAVTLLAVGEYGQMGFRQALYLNAFLLVELTKVAVRMIVAPAAGGLRLLNVSDGGAQRLYRILNVVVSVLGYGQLLIVPIVNRNVSFAAGAGVSALLALLVLLYLVIAVVRYRKPVADWLARRLASRAFHDETEQSASDAVPDRMKPGGILGSFIRLWHWFMLFYLFVMFVVIMTRPAEVVSAALAGSGKIAAAILVGSLIVGAFGRASKDGLPLPDSLTERLPLLENRVNSVAPKILTILRLLVAFGVLVYTINVIGLVGIAGWLSSDRGLAFSGAVVSVAFILVFAAGLWLALNAWIDYRLDVSHGKPPTSREKTLLTLFRNAATIALIILTLMFALSEIGINIGPLLASAGVLGLAIGFGAQKMVQDIITGVFIQLDNAMNVGDVVTVGGTTGTVEKLTIRSVSLRALDGTYHIIPFSSLDMVSNYMREFAYTVTDMGIAYREDIDEAKTAMHDAFATLQDSEQGADIIGDLEWFGVNSLGDSAVVLRTRIKTQPGSQWGIGRAYNELLKKLFDERGIEIPFPHQTLFFGENKEGSTQVLRLRDVGADEDRAEARRSRSGGGSDEATKHPTSDAPPDADLGPEAGENG